MRISEMRCTDDGGHPMRNTDWLNRKQLQLGMTAEQLAKAIGVSAEQVKLALASRVAPFEWNAIMTDKRAIKSQRLAAIRRSVAKRCA
jgi:hypothetical protein